MPPDEIRSFDGINSHFLNANRAVNGWAEFIESSGIPVPEDKYDIMSRFCNYLLEGEGGGP